MQDSIKLAIILPLLCIFLCCCLCCFALCHRRRKRQSHVYVVEDGAYRQHGQSYGQQPVQQKHHKGWFQGLKHHKNQPLPQEYQQQSYPYANSNAPTLPNGPPPPAYHQEQQWN